MIEFEADRQLRSALAEPHMPYCPRCQSRMLGNALAAAQVRDYVTAGTVMLKLRSELTDQRRFSTWLAERGLKRATVYRWIKLAQEADA